MQALVFMCAVFAAICFLLSFWVGGKTGDMLCYMAVTALLLGLVVAIAWAVTLPPSVDVF